RGAQIVEPAGADIEVGDGVAADLVIVANNYTLAASFLCATVFAQARTKRILRQAQQFPIAKPAEDGLFVINSLIHASSIRVRIATRTGVFKEIERRSPGRWIGD